jgi:GT2 family glycosyltransferase/glycosyltransferase involved in cell wall biosynthesis
MLNDRSRGFRSDDRRSVDGSGSTFGDNGAVHIVFVTTELAPLTPGGAGAVVARLRDRLTERGDRVSVILVGDFDVDLPGAVVAARSGATFEERSQAAAEAILGLVADGLPDLIEFQDFDGLAFHALAHRGEAGIDQVPVQVRFHGPADLMFEAIRVEPPEIAVARSMEISGFRMADRVVVPSSGIAALATDRYDLEADRVLVGTPPLAAPRSLDLGPAPTPTLVCVGRLGEVKGTHDLAAAAIPVLRDNPELRLVLIGEDGWSATARTSMSEWLTTDLIPEDIADRIELTGRLEGDALAQRMAEAWAIIIPSRFESFNLVAHEARSAGLPVIIPNLPAFDGVLNESTGAVVYDGTREGLTGAMRQIVEDEDLRQQLSAAPVPTYGDSLAPYETLPTVRHPRSQAGLATAAVQRLERERPTEPDEPASDVDERSRIRRTGYSALMAMSESQATTVVEAIPARLREKLGFVKDWRDEMRLREIAAQEEADKIRELVKRAALDARVAQGDFPDLDEPLVSVVVPCFNDGHYLDDSIRSVFNQTMTLFEVIVVDDGSTDPDTVAIIDTLPWTRTTVIRQANAGLSAARNAGMSAARGTYVVPLDADDELEPEFLEQMVAALEPKPAAAFAACRARLFEDIDAVWIPRPYNPYQVLLSNSIIGCVLLRRDAYVAVGGYDETMRHGNEDWDLWIRLAEAGWDVVEVPEVLFRYRKHGISMSVETEGRFEQGRAEIVERHRDLYTVDHLAGMKANHYPLVTIVATPGADVASLETQNLADAEIVSIGDPSQAWERFAGDRGWRIRSAASLDDAVALASGKFVVRWSSVADTKPDTVARLAERLEAAPNLGAARTDDPEPLVVVRRWSLLDPDAPSTVETVAASGTADARFAPGQFRDPAWTFPSVIDDVPVQRQRPEEEGHIPSWLSQ